MKTEMYRFETARFIVTATIQPDDDLDLSWMEDDFASETRAKLESGEYQAFGTIVRVTLRDGTQLGDDSLWGSIYANPREFFTDHRSADPMNRNCTIMRAACGNRTMICHYFPDMIRVAINNARCTLHTMPKLNH